MVGESQEAVSREHLELSVKAAYERTGIKPFRQAQIENYLEDLDKHDPPSHLHSMRVGLYSESIARYLPRVDPRALLYAGLLHDIGKVAVPVEVLRKAGSLTEADFDAIASHPLAGYSALQGILDYTAQIIVQHHRFQERSYPVTLPAPLVTFPQNVRKQIEYAAQLLSMADFYDAVTTRDNARGTPRAGSHEVIAAFEKERPKDAKLARSLIHEGFLSREVLLPPVRYAS